MISFTPPPLALPSSPRVFLLTQSPDHPDDYTAHIDNSSLETFSQCPRATYYKQGLARVPSNQIPLIFGGAIHVALDHYYKGGDIPTAISLAVSDYTARVPDPSFSGWRNVDRLTEVLNQYFSHYSSDPITTYPDKVEIPFTYPLGHFPLNTSIQSPHLWFDLPTPAPTLYIRNLDIVWTGRIDLIITHLGQFMLADHKTTSIEGPTFWEQFALSQQFIGYTTVAQSLFPDLLIKAALVNCIYMRPPTAKGIAKTEFMRQVFYYDQQKIEEWKKDIAMLIGNFVHYMLSGYFPKHTTWCISKYGRCPYHQVCQLPEEAQRQQALDSFEFTNNTWNPLDV